MPRSFLMTVCAALLLSSTAAGQTVVTTFSHEYSPNNSTNELLYLENGDRFKILIVDTDKENFEYAVTGITVNEPLDDYKNDNTTKEIIQQHSAKYGGYIVTVKMTGDLKKNCKSKNDQRPASCELGHRTWIIRTEETGWHTDIHVGLMASALVDPQYFLESDDEGNRTIGRDKGKEDDLTFGFSSFATLFHDNHPEWGASLGLGITDNNISVAIGPTLRLGKRGALTAGYSWGQVETLPAGLNVGDPFDGDNLTTTTSLQGGWFVAVTIRGFTNVFQKKLASSTLTID